MREVERRWRGWVSEDGRRWGEERRREMEDRLTAVLSILTAEEGGQRAVGGVEGEEEEELALLAEMKRAWEERVMAMDEEAMQEASLWQQPP